MDSKKVHRCTRLCWQYITASVKYALVASGLISTVAQSSVAAPSIKCLSYVAESYSAAACMILANGIRVTRWALQRTSQIGVITRHSLKGLPQIPRATCRFLFPLCMVQGFMICKQWNCPVAKVDENHTSSNQSLANPGCCRAQAHTACADASNRVKLFVFLVCRQAVHVRPAA
jgi:hypothetical protein